MKYITAVSLYMIVVLTFMQGWWLFTLVAVTLFSFRYGALVIIPTAIVLDGYYGFYYTFPILSVAAVDWFIFVEFLRPKVTKLSF
tara:strand:- start:5370 stop:5624 length:255 start_codon:yes stop_codon:yes gene_type:complete